MKKMNVFVTGPYGFVGQGVCQQLVQLNHSVIACSRKLKEKSYSIEGATYITYQDVPTNLKNIDVCIHLAARTHVMQETESNSYDAYANVNIKQTMQLAKQALQASVKRFIFVSSIKVLGEVSGDKPFSESSACYPEDDYGKTKLAAEQALAELFHHTTTELVVVRPPLVYGEGVKANFKSLVSLCKKCLPLPFGAIYNKRSLIYKGNLVDFLMLCCAHPKAANQIFLVSDDEDVSTTELVASICKGLDKNKWLIPLPQGMLITSLNFMQKQALVTRLFGNLQLDVSKAKTLLNWQPPYDFQESINHTVKA